MRHVALLLSGVLFAVGCSTAGDVADTNAAAVTATAHPGDPVTSAETINVRITRGSDGNLVRVWVPAQLNGITEHFLLDSGTARTWATLPGSTQDFTPDAFVTKIGDTELSILGRNVPPFDDTLDGRIAVGAVGIDFFSSGPTELDLGRSLLVRHPVGFVVPGSESWPTVAIQNSRGMIHGDVEIDGVRRHVIFDSGAPMTTLITDEHHDGDRPHVSHDVFGHPFNAWDGTGSLKLTAGDAIRTVPLERAPQFPHVTEVGQAIGVQIDGLVGLSGIGHGRILYDLAAGVLRFDPAGLE